jgi:hypothetical protein
MHFRSHKKFGFSSDRLSLIFRRFIASEFVPQIMARKNALAARTRLIQLECRPKSKISHQTIFFMTSAHRDTS